MRDTPEAYITRLNTYNEEIEQKTVLKPEKRFAGSTDFFRFKDWCDYLPYLASSLEALCVRMPVNIREHHNDVQKYALAVINNSDSILYTEWSYQLPEDVKIDLKYGRQMLAKFKKKLEHRRPGITL
jgi:hypothetical protein